MGGRRRDEDGVSTKMRAREEASRCDNLALPPFTNAVTHATLRTIPTPIPPSSQSSPRSPRSPEPRADERPATPQPPTSEAIRISRRQGQPRPAPQPQVGGAGHPPHSTAQHFLSLPSLHARSTLPSPGRPSTGCRPRDNDMTYMFAILQSALPTLAGDRGHTE